MSQTDTLYGYLKKIYSENEPIFLSDIDIKDMKPVYVRQQIKKLTEDGGDYEPISYTMIYNMGLMIELTVRDIDMMTVGEIIDLVYYRANQNKKRQERQEQNADNRVKATQADYDNF